jgi:Zinc carboxypeptidase
MRLPSGKLCEYAQAGRELLRRIWLLAVAAFLLTSVTATPASAQSAANDEEYGKKIHEFTTEPYFLTDLVDHLPASSTVPSPDKILGHIVGAPDFLTYSKDIYHYYDELAKATPRVKVYRVGKTEEGRDFLLVAVSDEGNIAQLDKFRDVTAKLADPRKISDADAKQLIVGGKPFYWASGSIHSPETGSPEMLMELAYRLAVEDSPYIQNIRKNAIFLITPIVEVDGHDRVVDSWNYKKANPDKPQPGLVYWGHYVQHDNNRDGIGMGLKLSQVMMQNFLYWHPQVLHDLHESVPYLYVSTGTGPYNAWLDPIVINEWQKLAYNDIQGMTERGVPGVWTHGFYDGWAANYMFYVANGHNSIGRFYETYGNGTPETKDAELPAASTSRTWFRPNPPLTKVKWSLRNNTNLQESGVLLALGYTADHGQELLKDFYEKSKRSVAKATTEGPVAWAIVNDGRRPALAAQLANLLQRQGVEVQKLEQDFDVKEKAAPPAKTAEAKPESKSDSKPEAGAKKPEEAKTAKIPLGSYIIRMDQPYSRMADMLLDTQYYSTNDPRPYDDTGWTLGPLRNVKTQRITDATILKAPMTLVDSPAKFDGGGVIPPHTPKTGKAPTTKFYVINATGEPSLAALRFRLKDAKFFAAEEGFEAAGQRFVAGSFLLPVEGNPADMDLRLNTAARELGVRVISAEAVPDVARHEIGVPRIAVMHNWTDTQNEGWFRLGLEESGVPYAYISDTTVRSTPNLREKYDVILFPPTFFGLQQILNGVPKRTLADGSDSGPIPFQTSSTTPNFGGVDETADIRGGLGFEGAAHIKKFVEDGGLFIPISNSSVLPIELGMSDTVSISETHQLQARGMIARANVEDKASPITYGYDDGVGVYFNQGPVFSVSVAGRFGRFFADAGPAGRTSGRGSATDPDIPQGRPWTEPEPPVHRSKAEQELYVNPAARGDLSSVLPPASLFPRVVLRFAPEKDLWVSGMLAGGSELAETPAIVDVPLGRGHVVLFATNPMWRQETQGSFMLLLNAALNFDHLNAGRKTPAPAKAKAEPAATKP